MFSVDLWRLIKIEVFPNLATSQSKSGASDVNKVAWFILLCSKVLTTSLQGSKTGGSQGKIKKQVRREKWFLIMQPLSDAVAKLPRCLRQFSFMFLSRKEELPHQHQAKWTFTLCQTSCLLRQFKAIWLLYLSSSKCRGLQVAALTSVRLNLMALVSRRPK